MDGEHFGTTAAGEAVQRFTIAGGGLTAKIMNWGAVGPGSASRRP